ncbi:MAG: cupin domain-containing protein [Robiginitalea sp.]|jgi:mannose-6-phosphate isomerase-like protein (cupin superfamily)
MKDQLTYMVLGHQVTPFDTSGDYNLVRGKTPGGMQGPPPHIHRKYDEVFFVMEGEMEFILDGNSISVGKGQMVDIPSGCLHTFYNKGDAPCTWLNIHSPKGFQAFFETFGVPLSERDSLQKSLSPDRVQSVLKRAPEFDMDIQLQ